jgi:hypothetical protein
MKTWSVPVLLVVALALALAGCGGGGGSSADPASLAPASAPVFIEATVSPEGTLKSDVESLAKNVAGIDNISEKVAEEIDRSASDATFEYAQDVEPWLGEKAGIYLAGYDGENFQDIGAAVETTDTGASEEFVDKFAKGENGETVEDASFEGVDYKVSSDGKAIGVVGDFLAYAQDEKSFKAMIEASDGESLADEDTYSSAISEAPSGSLADVFVDIGGLIKETGNKIDAETRLFLESAGIEPNEATAVASVVPGADQVEVDFSTDVFGESPQAGDASKLLGELPGGSLAAFASADFGKRFTESIDRLDANGIPGQLEPHELKSSLSAAGIDLDQIGASIGDIGVFAQGNTESNLTGALVLQTKGSKEATDTVANIGLLLRASHTPGVTAITGKASGFSIRSPGLGRQPLVVTAAGNRIAISYGLAASAQALTASGGATLAEDPAYKEAVASLGDTPISGFVDGPAALQLAGDLIPASEQEGFQRARPYLDKVAFAAIGSGASDDRTTAKMIVGFSK